jgi:outer membrane receptor protein involved in Fe transport
MLRGARVSLVVGNLFNERQDVRALDGSTPVNYQADLLDPLGRNVRLTFRKLFFPGMPPPGGRTG